MNATSASAIMGSLTAVTNWILEDDLLLLNSVEAGASLESLAKGAVCFSRCFTLQELQDRWRSLLYDLYTSVEASARLIDAEVDLFVPNPPKSAQTCDYKGKKDSFRKRKLDSVMSHYKAIRKRLKPQDDHPQNNVAVGAAIPDYNGALDMGYGHSVSVKDKLPDGVLENDYLYGCTEGMDSAGCDGATNLSDGVPSGELVNHILSDSDGVGCSSPYVDFSDDDEFSFLDVVEDITEGPCLNDLSSILLSSPSGTHQDDIPNSNDPTETEALNSNLVITGGSCSGGSYNIRDQIHFMDDEHSTISALESDVPATSSDTYHTAEPPFGVSIICSFNTEDLDMPCNTNVFLPSQMLLPCSDLDRTSMENILFCSVKALSNDQKPSVLTKMGLVPYLDACKVESYLFKGDPLHGISSSGSIPKEESTTMDSGKQVDFDDFLVPLSEKPATKFGNTKLNSRNTDDGCIQKVTVHDVIEKLLHSHAKLVSIDMGSSHPTENVSISDQEVKLSDSENEVPDFSCIESIILDMDLDPYDLESCPFTRGVSKYQHVDLRNTLSQLEQGTRSYLNRAIVSRGAFAIFYGRRLKYYIKDPEVSIGRATEEVKVDIDLGREGRANKISRLQAIIKLDQDGIFVLRNFGKCSIFVNGQELQSKKGMNLTTGSLIEISHMTFIFDINMGAVHRYIMAQRGGHEQSSRFDWTPDPNP